MKTLTCAAAVLLGLTSGAELSTDYATKRALRLESETTFFMETTSRTVNGESMDVGANFTETVHRLVDVVHLLEAKDGEPVLVRHAFEEVGGKLTMEFGERGGDERDLESPFEGAVVEVRKTEDGVESEVVEGDAPDDALEALGLRLSLDALLPADEVEVDESWDLEAEAVRDALGFDLRRALFPRPERPGGEDGDGRGRGGRGGGRGFGGGLGSLDEADWEGKATLVSLSVDHDGVTCAEVRLEIECTVDLPDPEFGGGRRGGRALEPGALGATAVEGELTVELEGRLLFAVEQRRPALLELSGDVSSYRNMERTRGETTWTMSTEQEGSLSLRVEITQQETE